MTQQHTGILQKMETHWAIPVQYNLLLNQDSIPMNLLIGQSVKLHWHNQIHCLHCGRITENSYFQGYCFPCFKTLPQTDDCIFNPEHCKAHEGISRDRRWSDQFCLQDHSVYLALTDIVKVGVTRSSQIPTRWIDQGAWKAIRLAKTPNRFLAGLIEVELKKHLSDKTNWRTMLTNAKAEHINLIDEKEKAAQWLSNSSKQYIDPDNEILEINYPIPVYPAKVGYADFAKSPIIEGVLTGIRGQYLIFEDGNVLNIRKFGGYLITLSHQ
jgi:hypothetical protein